MSKSTHELAARIELRDELSEMERRISGSSEVEDWQREVCVRLRTGRLIDDVAAETWDSLEVYLANLHYRQGLNPQNCEFELRKGDFLDFGQHLRQRLNGRLESWKENTWEAAYVFWLAGSISDWTAHRILSLLKEATTLDAFIYQAREFANERGRSQRDREFIQTQIDMNIWFHSVGDPIAL